MAVILRTAALITGTSMPTTGFTSLWWSPGTAGGSTADATDCLARFRTFWDTLKSHMDDGLTIDFDPICIAVEATTGALTGAFAGTDPLSVTGTAAGDPLPGQTQGLVRLATSTVVSGRRLRGRLFIPGPVEADNTSAGVPSSTYTTDVTTAAATLLAAGATASDAVIWHRPTGGAGGASADITGVGTASTWSVLRSRRS
jgi:hypothetical protein